MDFRQIEAYWAVMRCGSVTAAARLLNVSQPAISKTIRRAEDKLGIKLFERARGRMLPTAESHALFPNVDRIFRDIDTLKAQANDLGSMRKGVLRIGASSAIAASVMPGAVAAFQAAHPRAKIIAMMLPAAEIVEKLRANAIDLGFALNRAAEPDVKATPIGTTRLACLLPARHKLAALDAIGPRDLENYPIIAFPPTSLFGRALDDVFRAQGINWQLAIQVDLSFQAALFVRCGCGIALVDTQMRAVDLPDVVWRPFLPELVFPIFELVATDRPLSRAATVFRRLAKLETETASRIATLSEGH